MRKHLCMMIFFIFCSVCLGSTSLKSSGIEFERLSSLEKKYQELHSKFSKQIKYQLANAKLQFDDAIRAFNKAVNDHSRQKQKLQKHWHTAVRQKYNRSMRIEQDFYNKMVGAYQERMRGCRKGYAHQCRAAQSFLTNIKKSQKRLQTGIEESIKSDFKKYQDRQLKRTSERIQSKQREVNKAKMAYEKLSDKAKLSSTELASLSSQIKVIRHKISEITSQPETTWQNVSNKTYRIETASCLNKLNVIRGAFRPGMHAVIAKVPNQDSFVLIVRRLPRLSDTVAHSGMENKYGLIRLDRLSAPKSLPPNLAFKCPNSYKIPAILTSVAEGDSKEIKDGFILWQQTIRNKQKKNSQKFWGDVAALGAVLVGSAIATRKVTEAYIDYERKKARSECRASIVWRHPDAFISSLRDQENRQKKIISSIDQVLWKNPDDAELEIIKNRLQSALTRTSAVLKELGRIADDADRKDLHAEVIRGLFSVYLGENPKAVIGDIGAKVVHSLKRIYTQRRRINDLLTSIKGLNSYYYETIRMLAKRAGHTASLPNPNHQITQAEAMCQF